MSSESVLLDQMSGFEFEEFFARLLSKLGYGEIERVLFTQDEGRDILVKSPSGLVVVECKHHPNGSIGRPVVQKLHSAVISSRAVKGLLVTTGHFTKEALGYANKVSPAIEMIDHNILAEMAARAGIRLVSRGQDLSVWTYSIPTNDTTWNALASFIGSALQGFPRATSSLITYRHRLIQYEPIYLITYNVNAVFETSIGVIHRERAQHASIAIDGKNGQFLDSGTTTFITPEPPIRFLGASEEFEGQIPTFRLDDTSLRKIAKSNIATIHTRTKTYRGRNNQRYQKVCEPSDRDILITDIRPVHVPVLKLDFKLLQTSYRVSMLQIHSGRFFLRSEDITKCRVCQGSISKKGIVCDTCGRSTHSGGLFAKNVHGFRCRNCGRTTCRLDGAWKRRLLVFKALLCTACTAEAREKGSKVRPIGPLQI